MTIRLALVLFVLWLSPSSAAAQNRTEHLVLVTLDGARWQEIFTGLDEELLRASVAAGTDIRKLQVYTRFSGATPAARRAKLMPFVWNTLLEEHGFIAGNRAAGSQVSVTNRHRFSYPGYSELLTGRAHDDTIDSNEARRNPYPSVLQFLRARLRVDRSKVAAFASWYVFPWIVESKEGDITTNAGLQRYGGPGESMRLANELMLETPTPWDGVRYDSYTLRFGLDYLQRARPRVLYLAFDETDDWAHDGKYERVLDSLHRTDDYLRRLWEMLQRHPTYRARTTLLVTVDHGRGRGPADWRDHGSKVPGADEIWVAIASPDASRRGEWQGHPPLFQNQIAATIARFLGFDYREQSPDAGAAIHPLW